MKPTILKQISFAVLAMLAILLAAAATFPAPKSLPADNKEVIKKEAAAVSSSEAAAQCGVSNAQIADYLRNCSHHHTVYSVWDVPGTCNSKASIENCGTATVYVENGIVIGHSDSNGICD